MVIPEKPPGVKAELGLLEDDDDFEEFPAENQNNESEYEGDLQLGLHLDWVVECEDQDEEVSVWEDNWEDDVVQDDFAQQLKQQVEKLKELHSMD